MAKVVSVAIQKGGVGKTSLSVNLATGLNEHGKKVLLIDMDSQANASINFSVPRNNSLLNCLIDKVSIKDIIISTPFCDVVPSNITMSNFETKILELNKIGPDRFLYNKLKDVIDDYDYIIIDCPPILNFQTINALATSNSVLIVLEPNEFSIEGLTQFLTVYEMTKDAYGLEIEGIIFNKVNKQTKEFKAINSQIKEMFGDLVYDFYIPISQDVPTSQRYQNFKDNKAKPCIKAFPYGVASFAYKKLVQRIIDKENKL